MGEWAGGVVMMIIKSYLDGHGARVPTMPGTERSGVPSGCAFAGQAAFRKGGRALSVAAAVVAVVLAVATRTDAVCDGA